MSAGVSVTVHPADEDAEPVVVRADSASDLPPNVGATALHREVVTDGGGLTGCVACAHPELYTRKDFPRALGIGIVVLAAGLVPFLPKWYPSLIVAAALDLLLHWYAPEVVVCYVCEAEYRGFPARPRHPRFDRTIEERLRYGESAVMGSPMRPGGTADAPEPEH